MYLQSISVLFFLFFLYYWIMRTITKQACKAFQNWEKFTWNNTKTYNDNGIMYLELFGHKIAKIENKTLYITNAWWSTTTTRERLNGLDGVHIQQKNWQRYLNGNEWDGKWIAID